MRPTGPGPVVAAAAAALVAVLAVVADVRQQSDLAGALDGRRDLVLVTAAGARDAARADLARGRRCTSAGS
jgi:hypothetical protein